MKVKDLIEKLEDCNPEAEVRLAMQPRWAFEYCIENNIVQSEDEECVYLAEDNQIGYLPSEIAGKLGW
ncbi:MAG: hypothetical protein LBT27_06420 [Prevotellaceae bacterium]|jgi:hypothetical protein|nr:hypothetical protein [Prevotellaceae bacterium]